MPAAAAKNCKEGGPPPQRVIIPHTQLKYICITNKNKHKKKLNKRTLHYHHTNKHTHEKQSVGGSAPHQESRRRREEEIRKAGRQADRIVLCILAECHIVIVPSYLTVVQLNPPLFRIHKTLACSGMNGELFRKTNTRYMLCVEPLESLRGHRSACSNPRKQKIDL